MKPIGINRRNKRYFFYRGKDTFLITSAEHYGAVINRDFNFLPYLDTLKRHGFNLTRVFSGFYREKQGDFGITDNTLAAGDESFLCPWKKVNGKYDLDKWDESYFSRLKIFIKEAFRRGIIVEYTFFCFLYSDRSWELSPMNPKNNVNIRGGIKRWDVFVLKNNPLLNYQKRFVRKICGELKGAPNLYYEIINEPYSNHDAGDFEPWQDAVAGEIQKADKGGHMVARNFQNRVRLIEKPCPAVKIANFHYAGPEAVNLNYGLNMPIGDDETGFKGRKEAPYRREAWDFIMAGGAVFNNLDYSYTVKSPAGFDRIRGKTPGFGGEKLRRQLAFLKKFIESFKFVKMSPSPETATGTGRTFTASLEPAVIRILAERGRQYAIYIRDLGREKRVFFGLPKGGYRCVIYDVVNGKRIWRRKIKHPGGYAVFKFPGGSGEYALSVKIK